MANSVRAGYMGLAEFVSTQGSTQVRCTSFGINPSQDVLFYNHVIGLKDTIPSNNASKGENLDLTFANIQRRIWRPSPISISGGVSFPATETSLSNLFALARYGNYFDVNFNYYCDSEGITKNAKIFKDCRINGFDFAVTAGDILNVTLDVVAKNILTSNTNVSYKIPEKLITWDKVPVVVSNAPFSVTKTLIQGVNFKINNNIQTIYTAVSSTTQTGTTQSLLPSDLRVGMQEVSGSLTVYLDAGETFIPVDPSLPISNITITTPSLTLSMTVVFKSNQMEGAVGPIMTELPFVGVDYSFTTP